MNEKAIEALKEARAWLLKPENVDLNGSDRVYRLVDDALTALPPLRTREEIPEDVVLAFMRRSNLPSRAILEMTVTEWKDGIDIQRPSHSTMEFARALFTAGQEWREPNITEAWTAWDSWRGFGEDGDRMAHAINAAFPAPPVAEPTSESNVTHKPQEPKEIAANTEDSSGNFHIAMIPNPKA